MLEGYYCLGGKTLGTLMKAFSIKIVIYAFSEIAFALFVMDFWGENLYIVKVSINLIMWNAKDNLQAENIQILKRESIS